MENDYEMLTIHDIKARLNCATSTVYRWMERDEFPRPVKLGGIARWPRSDLDAFLDYAVKRRNDAGPRPKNVRRGRPAWGTKPVPRKIKKDDKNLSKDDE